MAEGNGRVSWGWVAGITIPLVLGIVAYIFVALEHRVAASEDKEILLEVRQATVESRVLTKLEEIERRLGKIEEKLP